MDHSLLVLSAQALRDIAAINEPTTSTATLTISRRTLEVATRSLDLVLTDRTMCELLLGFHNNQYIMICHSATEILRVSFDVTVDHSGTIRRLTLDTRLSNEAG